MTQASPVPSPAMPPSTLLPAGNAPTPQGGRLVAVAGQLPLRSAALAVDASAGIARVKLEQVFENPHAEPLRVKYVLPLPADAAVSGFAFRIGDKRIVGTVDEVKKARETFERAISEGRTAAILEETRTSLFSQELGNIPAGATVVAEILIDQPLVWVDVEGSWEWRFPLTAAPRFLGDASAPRGGLSGHTPDAARVMLDVTTDETGVRASLALQIRDALVSGRSPESPSHPLQIDGSGRGADGGLRVALGGGGSAALDRDLVVRWPVALATASISFAAARAGGAGADEELCAMLTVVPPAASLSRDAKRVPRDLILLLDTSGSMDGEPLTQAKRIACALVSSLGDGDSLEMIEFSSAARRFRRDPVRIAEGPRKEALAWLQRLQASSSTEMLDGITAALAGLRAEAQRQVVVVTDGLIGFERDVVSAVQTKLPRGSRVHAVGVGSSTNRTLLAGIARVGGGVEVIVGLGEDPERAARRVLARTEAPVIVDLAIEGASVREHAPARLPDLFAGSPARLAVRVAPGGGEIVVRGRAADGPWQARVTIPPRAETIGSDAPAKLFARERAADLEAELSAGRDTASVDRDLIALGLRYAIATRMTSWVAATEEVMVDPTEPTRRENVPHALAFGMSAAGLGLRQAATPMSYGFTGALAGPADLGATLGGMAPPQPPPGMAMPPSFAAPPPMPGRGGDMMKARVRSVTASTGAPPAAKAPAPPPPPPRMPAPMPAQVPPQDLKKGFDADEGGAPAAPPSEIDDLQMLEEAPAPAEAPPQQQGFFGGIAQKVRDFFASEPAPEPEPAAPEARQAREEERADEAKAAKPRFEPAKEKRAKGEAPAGAAGGPNVRVVAGRGTMLGDREIVIEIDVEGAALDLAELLLDVKLVTKLGAHLGGRLRVTSSTKPGTYGAGTTVRLVVTLDEAPTAEIALAFFSSARPAAPVIRVELATS
jgi:Ca-activated chloride channel family protein